MTSFNKRAAEEMFRLIRQSVKDESSPLAEVVIVRRNARGKLLKANFRTKQDKSRNFEEPT